jgi:hypothetical protein
MDRSFRDLTVQNYREVAVQARCAALARLREQEPTAGSCPDLVGAARYVPELPVAGQQVFPARTRCSRAPSSSGARHCYCFFHPLAVDALPDEFPFPAVPLRGLLPAVPLPARHCAALRSGCRECPSDEQWVDLFARAVLLVHYAPAVRLAHSETADAEHSGH